MKRRYIASLLVLAACLALGTPVAAGAATIEVSQPVQVTFDAHYERGQAIVFDGADYWLFYGRSATVTGNYQNDNPDVYDYQVYFKKAASVAGLAAATAQAIPGAVNCYNGEIGAAVHDGRVWTFAAVPSLNFAGRRSLYGWYTADGGATWTQRADLADNLPDGAAHHDEVSFGGELFVMANYPDGNAGWHTKHAADPTAATISWSAYVPLNAVSNLVNGTGHFFVDGATLRIAILRTSPSKDNKVLEYVASPEAWSELCTAASTGWDPTLVKVGSAWLFAQAPWTSDGGGWQHVIGWSGSDLATLFTGTATMISEARYGVNTWVDMWPIGFTDDGGTSYLFLTSERDEPGQEGTGNIWFYELDWDLASEHFSWVQEGIDAASSGDVVRVAAGTYEENVSVGAGIELRGAQAGVDARGRSADETELTCAAGDLVTIGGSGVVLDGLTFSGTASAGRLVDGEDHGAGLRVSNCRLGGTAVHAFWFNVTSPGILIEKCVIDGSSLTASNALGFFDGADVFDDLTIRDNEFASGEIFAGNKTYNSARLVLSGNLFDGAHLNLSSQFQDATISGNTFRNNGYTNMQAGLLNSSVTGNVFEATGPSPHAGYPSSAMMLWGDNYGLTPSGNVAIEGNVFHFNDFSAPDEPSNGLRILSAIDAATITLAGNAFVDGGAAVATAVLNGGTGVADASGNWWGHADTASVAAVVDANVDYTPWLDDGIDTSGDPGFQGDFSVLHVDDDSPQGGGGGGYVQEGIDLLSGSTLYLHAGLYEGQVEIAGDMTLIGDGAGSTTILSPVNLATFFGTNYPVVYVHDADDVTIRDLTVDGGGRGNANYRFVGVAFNNAGGTVRDCVVTGIMDTPFSGAQHGVALYSWNDDGEARSIALVDNVIDDFQKNAVAFASSETTPLVVDISGNDITGAGATDVTAQNGIQLYGSLVSGSIDGNTVAGIGYDNTEAATKWVASSILQYYSSADVTGNTVTGTHVGLYNYDAAGLIEGNDFAIEKIGVSAFGIIATDPPEVVPSPIEPDDPPVGRGMLAAPLALLSSDIEGNSVVFGGSDNTATYGIEADGGYATDDLALAITGNTVTGFEVGIEIWQCQSGCDTGVFTTVSANENDLGGNTLFGIRSNADYITVDGRWNWWGDATGPRHATLNPGGLGVPVSDYVLFEPWLGAVNAVAISPDSAVTNCTTPETLVFGIAQAGLADEVRGWEVTFTVDPAVATVADPDAHIIEGDWLSDVGTTQFFVLDGGGGIYTVVCAILGGDTGATGAGELFSVLLTPVADGVTAVAVTSLKIRDLDNDPLDAAATGGMLLVDCDPPTMEPIAETPGGWYNTAPVLSNFGFDDDENLDTAEYRIDGGGWTALFAGIDALEWNDDGWTLPGFDALAQGAHTVFFRVADDAGNWNGEGTPDTYSWLFNKDTVAPDPPTSFVALPGHDKVHLTWSNPTGDATFDHVEIRRVAWGDYPEYVTPPAYPVDHTQGAHVAAVSGESHDDALATRDVYYFAAFSVDLAGNVSVFDAGAADRSTSYWLGDIASPWDGLVNTSDLVPFSNAFGTVQGGPGWFNECDIGPTDDWRRNGVPEPDDAVDFEDLMIFSMNHGNVSPLGHPLEFAERAIECLEDLVSVRLEPASDGSGAIAVFLENRASSLKGVRLVVSHDAPVGVLPGEAAAGDCFVGSIGRGEGRTEICVAALGVGAAIEKSGPIALLRGAAACGLVEVEVRDIGNESVELLSGGGGGNDEVPTVTRLFGNFPNPFNPVTTIRFDLASPAPVSIRIYDASGRLVRILVDERRLPGSYEVTWNGRNDTGSETPSGVYFCRMFCGGYASTSKMVLLR
ncbi:MAG: T9SS type A sorting domain-containing protein [Candidatus Krumholzibacteriota bacterium]|nr:T9SS type A sorting domain-containing protein [Candidatus Krumholzibacteriota bacterium]